MRWKNERLKPILEQLAVEEEKLDTTAQEDAEAVELLQKKNKKSKKREDEERREFKGF